MYNRALVHYKILRFARGKWKDSLLIRIVNSYSRADAVFFPANRMLCAFYVYYR